MLKSMLLLSFVFLVGLSACGQEPKESEESEWAQETQWQQAQLRKIPIQSPGDVDSLRSLGLDVIVEEAAFVVVHMQPADTNIVRTANITTQPIQESDLIQRLVKIPIAQGERINALTDIGMDVWEVRQDTVVAQAYDKYIREARHQGFEVFVVAENVLDLVREDDRK